MPNEVRPSEKETEALQPSSKRMRVKVKGINGLFVDVTPTGL
jgi:hypothetical protein